MVISPCVAKELPWCLSNRAVRYLVQIYWLIMNRFALVLEHLEDFPFALLPDITFLLARVIFYAT